VVVNDRSRAVLISNTLVKNGGGVAFLGSSQSEASGNVIGLNKIGFLFGGSARAVTAFNALHNSEGNYMRAGVPPTPALEFTSQSDIPGDPLFVDAEHDDFRLRSDTKLLDRGPFRYLGAFPPLSISPSVGLKK